MGFELLDIKISYKNYDENEETITKSFLNPCLKESKLYQRSVGFFSSSVFTNITEGISHLVQNNGSIQLITTPLLCEEDMKAINTGLILKNQVISDSFEKHFMNEIDKIDDKNLLLLVELVSKGKLEIKIVTTKELGEYHDKLGILTDKDNDDNKIVFFGSSNSSNNGYNYNYEKIRTVCSWYDYEKEIIDDEVKEFEDLWNGRNSFVNVVDYSQAAKDGILKVKESRGLSVEKKSPVVLRDYQIEAIDAWKNNGYNGFFVMATGTGKTFTAIYGLKQLVEETKRIIVICAPYKHLIKQWCADLEKVFPEAIIIMAFSENIGWEFQIKEAIMKQKYHKDKQIIIVSTIISFQMEKFEKALKGSNLDRILVVDEAHRFVTRTEETRSKYIYMLGLSATPTNGKNANEAIDLVNYFGGTVFNLPIEKALDGKFLVPYNYYPIYVNATFQEEEDFAFATRQMVTCFRNGKCIDKDKLLKVSRKRLRTISNAENKICMIEDILLNQIKEKDHLVVYCGDGKLFLEENDESKYINYVKDILNRNEYKSSQFTASENMKERMDLVDMFDKGVIDSLVAIKCLDEGINIPSIKAALILSSNDDLKEFVQRRGRILRRYPNKVQANIYDVVVLPSTEVTSMAKLELRRVYEYARLSDNFNDTKNEILRLLEYYNINLEEIEINDELFEEELQDE